MLGKAGWYVMTKGTVSVWFGFKSVVARNARSPLYLGFKKIWSITPIDEVVHEFLRTLFVSVVVGAYASKVKCKAIWNKTFSVGGG